MEEKKVQTPEEVEVTIVRKCKNCGQILSATAQDCWKCSSTDIIETAEELTEELQKETLEAKVDRLENQFKKSQILSYVMIGVVALLILLWIIL